MSRSITSRITNRLTGWFRPGPITRYYRDIVRPRITKAAPLTIPARCGVEVHVLTSSGDWLNALWAIRSLLRVWPEPLAVVVHDDGSLTAGQAATLLGALPGVRLVSRTAADREVDAALAAFPRCQAFRRTNALAAKLFDFRHFLNADVMLLLDSDVLFFDTPVELLNAAKASPTVNVFNAGQRSMYTLPPEELRRLTGLEIPERLNSGLAIVARESMRLEWLEEFLGLPGIMGHHWRIEQTLYTLCAARHGAGLLSSAYDVTLHRHAPSGVPCRHYVGPIRDLMYREGVARLAPLMLR